MVDIIAARPETSDGGTILPQLPESQVARPPTAPGRAVPGDASAVQVGATPPPCCLRPCTLCGMRVSGKRMQKPPFDSQNLAGIA